MCPASDERNGSVFATLTRADRKGADMRVPLSWVREYTPLDATTDEIVAALNRLGLEVEHVDEPGREIVGVTTAKILEIAPIPKKDRVRLATVDVGGDVTTVVCGAPNIEVGQTVPIAREGATLPGGFTLSRKSFGGGVFSDGMLCSARELGLGDDHSGILVLDSTTELGADIRDVLGLNDTILELDITPNRPDAMGVVGVARELAAAFGLPLHAPAPEPRTEASVTNDVTIAVEAPDRCPRFLARTARVAMGESPAWMQQRLIKAGMRPISNVVDVTNYVMLELCRPTHAYDRALLAGPGFVVRLADEGETLTTLDGVTRTCTHEDLLICDAARVPQALAGVMGGATSEVHDGTTEIVLEVAHFERMGVAKTSKRHKLRSEASARFERGTDPNGVDVGAARVMELLAEVAGAEVSPNVVDHYPVPVERARVTVRTSKVNAVLGTELADTEVIDALAPLGIEVSGAGDAIETVVPTFRPDLEREIDLVEEVARRIGFERIGRTVPKSKDQVGGLNRRQLDVRRAADTLVGNGYSEAITIPLVAPTDLERVGAPIERLVRASNPLRAEESVLRTRILPGLLRALAHNHSHGQTDIALFEIGAVFLAPTDASLLPDEPLHLGAVRAGTIARRPVESDRAVDVYDMVDTVRALVSSLGRGDAVLEPVTVPGFHGARSAQVSVNDVAIGTVGEIDPEVIDALGLSRPVVALELDLGALLDQPSADQQFDGLSRFPASNIDLAFVLDESVAAASVMRTLRAAVGELAESVTVFDEYRDDRLGAGKRSLAFALRFRAPDRTLTDDEVTEARQRAIDATIAAHGASLRA